MCVRVLHIKPLFLLVDIEHTQCPRRLFLLEGFKHWSQDHDPEILHCNAVSRVDNAVNLEYN